MKSQIIIGAPFWSGPKRCPKSLTFDPLDQTHCEYVVAAAHLHAENYSIKSNMTNDELVKKAADIKVTEFVAKKVKIAVTDAEGQF